ncbi:MAG: Asp-tRNA(Asn)/Glu-tRNA(Gln) amidotransferase subunit GatA [Lachnospiraceae bacterium]|nr:Asp-tRNA(Asn)/Glu-tRNA(Gln) amidotransferase subunit GatA [Lachnospiraceae bacterium]
MQITELTALELGRKIKKKEISVREALDASYQKIETADGELNSFVTLDQEAAYARAEKVQAGIADGSIAGPLAGVPTAIKDNICTEGLRTTCSSKILYNFVPTYQAEVIRNMEKAGAVILGKTNMDEFAMGSTTETSAFGPTKNPWNTNHVPGGSSGGSCVAVAAGEAPYALGSDTGGSIRQPSSFCGVVGMKPTYGTVSRYGLIAYGSSLDQIGPIAKDVSDCAAILEMIASHDKKDSTSVARSDYDFTSALVDDVKGLRVGIPSDYLGEGLDDEVRQAVLDAADVLRQKGAVVEEFDLSLVEYAIPAYYVIASAEASSNLARFDGVKYGYRSEQYEGLHSMYKKSRSEGFGEEVKRRIMLGSFVLSSGYYDAYYLKALRTKALIKQSFDRAFEKYDVILAPASPTTAPELGKSLSDPLKMYLGDIYTISVNLAGLPGISVPCCLDSKGLPIGVQMIGDCFKEKSILRAAYAYEQARGNFPMPVIAGTDTDACPNASAAGSAQNTAVSAADSAQNTAVSAAGSTQNTAVSAAGSAPDTAAGSVQNTAAAEQEGE